MQPHPEDEAARAGEALVAGRRLVHEAQLEQVACAGGGATEESERGEEEEGRRRRGGEEVGREGFGSGDAPLHMMFSSHSNGCARVPFQ